jgi:hypothetical protein
MASLPGVAGVPTSLEMELHAVGIPLLADSMLPASSCDSLPSPVPRQREALPAGAEAAPPCGHPSAASLATGRVLAGGEWGKGVKEKGIIEADMWVHLSGVYRTFLTETLCSWSWSWTMCQTGPLLQKLRSRATPSWSWWSRAEKIGAEQSQTGPYFRVLGPPEDATKWSGQSHPGDKSTPDWSATSRAESVVDIEPYSSWIVAGIFAVATVGSVVLSNAEETPTMLPGGSVRKGNPCWVSGCL